jgi:glycosyltransferase involved in cell wall biosynthesis
MSNRKKLVVLQHAFGTPTTGGPSAALERMLNDPEAAEFDFPIMRQDAPAGGINIGLIRSFVRTIREVNPDLVHVRGLGNEGFHAVLACRLAGIKNVVLSIHGTVRDIRSSKFSFRRTFVWFFLESITLKLASHYITVCVFAARRDFLIAHKKKFLGVVYNGITATRASETIRLETRLRLAIDPVEIVCVCVSRMTWQKGYAELSRALSVLPNLKDRLTVLMVGDGPDREDIQKFMVSRPDITIRFLGERRDVGEILAASDIFLFPSLHENFSNALIEAMSNGLPSVAFDVGGNSEALAKGGGFVIEPFDTEEFSKKLLAYISSPSLREETGATALSVVSENFTTRQMAKNMFAIYRDLCGSSK